MSASLLSISEIDRALDRVSPHKALAFARHVAHLLEVNAVTRPRSHSNANTRLQIVTVGVVFAAHIDLGIKVRLASVLVPPAYRSGVTAADFFREIVQFDIPDYAPIEPPFSRPKCPDQIGPRGGKCQAKGTRVIARHITNPETGDYVLAEWCRDHVAAAIARDVAAPTPPNNTGGVLLGTFPEYDFDTYYKKNGYQVRNVDEAETTVKPRLRVIDGGLA